MGAGAKLFIVTFRDQVFPHGKADADDHLRAPAARRAEGASPEDAAAVKVQDAQDVRAVGAAPFAGLTRSDRPLDGHKNHSQSCSDDGEGPPNQSRYQCVAKDCPHNANNVTEVAIHRRQSMSAHNDPGSLPPRRRSKKKTMSPMQPRSPNKRPTL